MGSVTEDFRIIIAGGGIAGLATAIALRAPNRQITVLERSRMLGEVGALISLQPNATKIVSKWGIDKFLEQAEPMPDRAFRIFNPEGKMVRDMRLETEMFGADRMLYHRQDLHQGLLDAATSPDLPGEPAVVRTASAVASCDPDAGTVTLQSGETLDADLIIGADGIHSAIRTAVLGEERSAIPTGISAYRLLIPIENLQGLDLPEKLIDTSRSSREGSTTMVMGHDKRVVMGPGRGGRVFGVVALVPDEKMNEASSTVSWVETGSRQKLMASYADFPDWLRAIFARAPDIALWQLRDIDPLPAWTRGRAILSMEDAEALQAFFRQHVGGSRRPSVTEITSALRSVVAARYERASLIQLYSRQQARPATDSKASNTVTLDPAQFMKYNCDYHGAEAWLANQQATKSNSDPRPEASS
ncbi:hypothetical protein PG994_002686 [Apiospora phragmitis]|uniref:FAD-binding domain-containing protein n=1 Tax=Apiospora phragmitis TaxID=2905665 RepID=A0ABR1W5V5_9PEZI